MRILILAVLFSMQIRSAQTGLQLPVKPPSGNKCIHDPSELLHRVLENDIINEQAVQRYIYKIELEKYATGLLAGRFPSLHDPKMKTGSEVDEVFVLYGEEVTRKVEENGKPISDQSS